MNRTEQNRTKRNLERRDHKWDSVALFTLLLFLFPNGVFAEDVTTIRVAKASMIEHALVKGYDLSSSRAEVVSGGTALSMLGEPFLGEAQKVLQAHLETALAVVVYTEHVELVWIPFEPDSKAANFFQTEGALIPTGTIHRPNYLIGIQKFSHSACSGCRSGVDDMCLTCDFAESYTLPIDVLDSMTLQQHGLGPISRWTETVGESYDW